LTRCRCVQCGNKTEYDDLLAQFKNVTDILEEAGQSTNPNFTQQIDEIQNLIDALTIFCLNNNTDIKYISDKILYIKTLIVPLTLDVKAFVNDLKADSSCKGKKCKYLYKLRISDCVCVCSLNCKTSKGEFNDFKYCQCGNFSDATILYGLRGQITNEIKTVSTYVKNTTLEHEILIRLYELLGESNKLRTNLEYNYETLNLTLISEMIKKYQTTLQTIHTDYTTSIVKSPCKTPCSANTIETKNCTCYKTTQVDTFYADLALFISIEGKIWTYTGDGPGTELDQFEERTVEIRKLFQEIQYYIYNNYPGLNITYIQELLDNLLVQINTLTKDFNDWVSENSDDPPPCVKTCGASEITNMKTCVCVLITDWDKLPAAQASLPALLETIKNLEIDTKNKNTLIANWNLINSSIAGLYKYTIDYSKNLDVVYVQASTTLALTQLEKLQEDTELIQSGKFTTTCAKTCPTIYWDYSASACSCSCEVSGCNASTERIDYWNCKCAPFKDSCTLNKEQCAKDNDKLLDYSACLCKPKP